MRWPTRVITAEPSAAIAFWNEGVVERDEGLHSAGHVSPSFEEKPVTDERSGENAARGNQGDLLVIALPEDAHRALLPQDQVPVARAHSSRRREDVGERGIAACFERTGIDETDAVVGVHVDALAVVARRE